jgi:hypothetical protein
VVTGLAAKLPPALVCRLYSEDGADASRDTLEQIVRGMLRLVEEHVKTNHIDFKPLGRYITGSHWKVTSQSKDTGVQQKRRDLLKEIATELILERVVFFHVDGDCTWAENEQAEVRRHLEQFRQDLPRADPQARLDASTVDKEFIEVIPFYSIESWLYACTERLCTHTSHATELGRIAEWAADLRKLDEVREIKDVLPSIKNRHNHELARHIPAAALCAADKSYAKAVERVRGSARVRAGLDETLRRDW